MITALDPSTYQRTPWKNGGGTTVDIVLEGDLWRFGRTPIVAAGPFSDYAGCDRVQVLVAGRGLVLETPAGEIDVRTPFRPVRFAGETAITSRLEAGPVEVVNLIGRRAAVAIDLTVHAGGGSQALAAGTHIVYCPAGTATVMADSVCHKLEADHGLRIDATRSTMLACRDGRIIVASIV